MPVLFIGHGNPMLAITDNPYKKVWQEIAPTLPKPKAILCISAHWETLEPSICSANPPQTIHDFGGFPAELFAQRYPAPGAPELVTAVQTLIPSIIVTERWGLDHGAWCVLASLFPQADIPVCQLSLARSFSPEQHFKFAEQLHNLREQGYLIIGSGNIVHNLRELADAEAHDWAIQFDNYIKEALTAGNHQALIDFPQAGFCAQMSVPTLEHYLPLLYCAAISKKEDTLTFFNEDFDLASLSMRSVIWS